MAVNPIQFLVAQNASITDGTKTISISGNVDCSRVYSGTAVFLGGADNPAEAVSGTSPNGSGVSTITLRNNWSQGDIVNQQLVSFNTNEGLAEAISNVREIVSNVSAIEDLATQGLIKRISDNVYEVVNISAVGESLITANDASSQRSVLGLGSAATRNVGTSAGNVMEVISTGIEVTDFSTNMPTTFSCAWGQSGVANAPVGGSINWTALRVAGSNLNNGLELFSANGANRYFLRSESGNVYSSFSELYHSGNSVNPLDYGLGALAPAISDAFQELEGGIYSGSGAGAVNFPAGMGYGVFFNGVRQNNNAVNGRLYIGDVSGTAAAYIGFSNDNGQTFDHQELYHSGNSVNPLDYGLCRVVTGPIIDGDKIAKNDLNTPSQPTQAFVFDSDTVNRPVTHYGGIVTNGVGLTISRADNIWGQITISRSSGNLGETVIRAKDGTNIIERTVFDSGNTNFNEYRSSGAGDILARGYAFSPTGCTFYIPNVSGQIPTSLSIVGDFEIAERTTQSLLHSSVTNLVLTARSSPNLIYIEATGLSGFTQGQDLVLRSKVGSSFTVNF